MECSSRHWPLSVATALPPNSWPFDLLRCRKPDDRRLRSSGRPPFPLSFTSPSSILPPFFCHPSCPRTPSARPLLSPDRVLTQSSLPSTSLWTHQIIHRIDGEVQFKPVMNLVSYDEIPSPVPLHNKTQYFNACEKIYKVGMLVPTYLHK